MNECEDVCVVVKKEKNKTNPMYSMQCTVKYLYIISETMINLMAY